MTTSPLLHPSQTQEVQLNFYFAQDLKPLRKKEQKGERTE